MSDVMLFANWPVPPHIIAGTTLRHGGEAELPVVPHYLQQVHGTRVVRLGTADFADGSPVADAVIGERPGDMCVVRTADCLPVLLCSIDGTEFAAVHAGWRGLAAGVIETAVAAMRSEAGRLVAWLGPAISQAAFEVGDEVRQQFAAGGELPDELFVANARGRWQADLYGLARLRLCRLGITRVHGGGHCTFADAERFYSYRRDGQTGRLLSFVYRK